ncbi:hypothetical protein [Streptomyces sp. NPDC056628]|uniref:hypothetical protein n=1 Tax=Streptomyces sp. NPDC056628 TaxID=3345882 RepID=UPI0036B9F33B
MRDRAPLSHQWLLALRTMKQLGGLLAGLHPVLSDEVLEQIALPGVGTRDQAYVPPSIEQPELRRPRVDEPFIV